MEPLSVAIHSVSNLGNFRANQSIAIFGCGPIGLVCMAVAKALGASRIIAVDIVPSRVDFAKSYAATETYLSSASGPEPGESKLDYSERIAVAMKKQLGIENRGPKSIDLIIDARYYHLWRYSEDVTFSFTVGQSCRSRRRFT
jgi:D-xylulose reductase